jgi:hypothetical protein
VPGVYWIVQVVALPNHLGKDVLGRVHLCRVDPRKQVSEGGKRRNEVGRGGGPKMRIIGFEVGVLGDMLRSDGVSGSGLDG